MAWNSTCYEDTKEKRNRPWAQKHIHVVTKVKIKTGNREGFEPNLNLSSIQKFVCSLKKIRTTKYGIRTPSALYKNSFGEKDIWVGRTQLRPLSSIQKFVRSFLQLTALNGACSGTPRLVITGDDTYYNIHEHIIKQTCNLIPYHTLSYLTKLSFN